jgi:hypothetical protein
MHTHQCPICTDEYHCDIEDCSQEEQLPCDDCAADMEDEIIDESGQLIDYDTD